MYKIRKVKFKDHPILKNLELDFCGNDGKAVDTIILAGENGTGKSTIMNELFKIADYSNSCPCNIEIEKDDKTIYLEYYLKALVSGELGLYVNDNNGINSLVFDHAVKNKYQFSAIYSDVDINFHSNNVSNVTSLTLDAETKSRKSANDLPTQIKQLLIDIQALDDGELSRIARSNPNKAFSKLAFDERMPRFTTAFNMMFEELSYNRIENKNGYKQIIFKKNDSDILIDDLSSGEKQVVYRGCFLLKDVNAMNGAFVFIDEPEISLHPTWQQKIMDYYKNIFTNSNGMQTSQIFAVTHSPFIIHNDNRKNDKVIVLARDENGDIVVIDKPEYYKCGSVSVVQDAFSIKDFFPQQPTVYLEGQTDEKYFNKAIEVFDYKVPFKFKWVGYIDKNGQEVNTGDKSVDKAFHFLAAQNTDIKYICLKDCDTNAQTKRVNNVIATSIPKYNNKKEMTKGIENALVLDDIDLSEFRTNKEKPDGYGGITKYQEFDKMACCDAICSLDKKVLKTVFANLKKTIDNLITLYSED